MSEEKKGFVVRQNCEYSVFIEAKDEEDAMTQADAMPLHDWSQAWSSMDAEEE